MCVGGGHDADFKRIQANGLLQLEATLQRFSKKTGSRCAAHGLAVFTGRQWLLEAAFFIGVTDTEGTFAIPLNLINLGERFVLRTS